MKPTHVAEAEEIVGRLLRQALDLQAAPSYRPIERECPTLARAIADLERLQSIVREAWDRMVAKAG